MQKKIIGTFIILTIILISTSGCLNTNDDNDDEDYYYQLYYSITITSDKNVNYTLYLPSSENLTTLFEEIKLESGEIEYSYEKFNNSDVLMIKGRDSVELSFSKEYKDHPKFTFSLIDEERYFADIYAKIFPENSSLDLNWHFTDYYNHPLGMGWGLIIDANITNGWQSIRLIHQDLV